MKTKWEKVGVIGVDAGLCWLGDPCYILHKNPDENPDDIGKSWKNFCKRLGDEDTVQFHYNKDLPSPGLGVCVSAGWGDGSYDVFVKRTRGRIAEVKVVFIEDEE